MENKRRGSYQTLLTNKKQGIIDHTHADNIKSQQSFQSFPFTAENAEYEYFVILGSFEIIKKHSTALIQA
jgi:hypothetical protein